MTKSSLLPSGIPSFCGQLIFALGADTPQGSISSFVMAVLFSNSTPHPNTTSSHLKVNFNDANTMYWLSTFLAIKKSDFLLHKQVKQGRLVNNLTHKDCTLWLICSLKRTWSAHICHLVLCWKAKNKFQIEFNSLHIICFHSLSNHLNFTWKSYNSYYIIKILHISIIISLSRTIQSFLGVFSCLNYFQLPTHKKIILSFF